jgi:hypothetical protein
LFGGEGFSGELQQNSFENWLRHVLDRYFHMQKAISQMLRKMIGNDHPG